MVVRRMKAVLHEELTRCSVGVSLDAIELVHLMLDPGVKCDVDSECDKCEKGCEERSDGSNQSHGDVGGERKHKCDERHTSSCQMVQQLKQKFKVLRHTDGMYRQATGPRRADSNKAVEILAVVNRRGVRMVRGTTSPVPTCIVPAVRPECKSVSFFHISKGRKPRTRYHTVS